ncbi:MAG: glucose-6-phosphate isomerase [Lachnospiraceae bacterium]|nr:glucose-6-phosphate isomerase [Lachnospiraceae bacterium]
MKVRFDYSKAKEFIDEKALEAIKKRAEAAKKVLLDGSGAGADFRGWIDLPVDYDKEEFARIEKAAAKIREDSDVLFVIGIGGSYLGARAANEFLNHNFYNKLSKEERKAPEIYYAGNSISGTYLAELLEILGDRDFSVNVISKSGTTTEPAIAFRVFKELAEKKYGKEGAAKRIYATTDKARGALKTLADGEGYECFVVPDDVGGRYSVLTAVGLLPIAATGADIRGLMKGAADMREHCMNAPVDENDAMLYAACRDLFYENGKGVEILVNYEPNFHYVSEWWKQLYGESEGKDHKSLFPAAVDFTTDLHSMGQFIQQGTPLHFETVVDVEESRKCVVVGSDESNLDGLNYLAGRDMNYVNHCAMNGTILAHKEGGVPNLVVRVKDQSAEALGQLFYFFEFACGVSGYTVGINPFDQPGVELYKRNMFGLLGKPGYESLTEDLRKRL